MASTVCQQAAKDDNIKQGAMKIGIESLHFDRRKFVEPERHVGGITAYCHALGVDRVDLHSHSVPGRLRPNTIKRIDDAFHQEGVRIVQTAAGFLGVDVHNGTSCRAGLERARQHLERIVASTIRIANVFPVVGPGDEDGWQRFVDTYGQLLESAGRLGLRLAFHHRCYDEARRLVDTLPHPANGVLLCLGWFHEFNSPPLPECIRSLGDRILHVHVRDPIPGKGDQLLGQGEVDLPGSLAALAEIGYDGTVTHEHTTHVIGQVDSEISTAWGVGYLRGLMTRLGIPEG